MNFSLTLQINEMIAVATILETAVFMAFLSLGQYRNQISNLLISFFFFLILLTKIDQIYQFQGGFQAFPSFAYILSPFQFLIAPTLYLIVRAKTETRFGLKLPHVIHIVPAMALCAYYASFIYGQGDEAIREIIADGRTGGLIGNLLIPLAGDLLSIGYITAAILRLKALGISLKSWFAGNEDEALRGLQLFLFVWISISIVHFCVISLSPAIDIEALARSLFEIMNALQFVLINIVMYFAVVSFKRWPETLNSWESFKSDKYATSSLNSNERQALYEKTVDHLNSTKAFQNSRLTLGLLSDAVAATPRELSEAINEVGRKSYYNFINDFRVEYAAACIKADDHRTILEIALESGFNSKSSFNTQFKKYFGVTPTDYRSTDQPPKNDT